jgi:hypothetical protein
MYSYTHYTRIQLQLLIRMCAACRSMQVTRKRFAVPLLRCIFPAS